MNKIQNICFTVVLIVFCNLSFSQEMKRYTCNGEGKAQGLKFSINYPSTWTVTEGIKPHILKTFDYDDKKGRVSMVVYVKKQEETPTKEEIDFVFQKDLITSNPPFIGAKVIEFKNDAQIEDLRCMSITAFVNSKVYDAEIHGIVKDNYIYFDKYLIQVNFFVISDDQKYETMIQMYNSYNPVFKEMIYSLSINSRWK